jgi:16S rRNA (adenine1518-N6/adenine1519-N6)-dimethyltransferase
MKAKKSFGQHFLVNEDISSRIANSLTLTNLYDKVVEVGPGKGVLTKYLLERDFELWAVEADRDMVQYLNSNYSEISDYIIPADFLKVDLNLFLKNKPFALIGNFPYNISSQILFKMLEHREQIPEMVGMFQKEVAERVVAGPGSKTYGVISVLIQAYYEGKVLFNVSPGNFNPPPKVQSAVIRLVRKENAELGCDEKLFKQIVKQTFGQRRKMLRNTMKTFLKDDEIIQDEFFQQRPERLSLDDFIQLTKWVEERIKE